MGRELTAKQQALRRNIESAKPVAIALGLKWTYVSSRDVAAELKRLGMPDLGAQIYLVFDKRRWIDTGKTVKSHNGNPIKLWMIRTYR